MEPRREPEPPWLPAARRTPRRPVPGAGARPALPPAPPPLPPPRSAPRPRWDWRRLLRSPRGAACVAVLSAALLLWPFAGFSWIPWLAGVGAAVVLRLLRFDGPLRGWDLPLAGLVVVVGLMLSTGPWAWALAASIGVLLAGLAQLPWWRLAAVGAVLCVVSGIGFGSSLVQDRAEQEQQQVQANDTAAAAIAQRSEEILPAFLRALDQPLPDPQPICRFLEADAKAQLAAAAGRQTCEESVDVLHTRMQSVPRAQGKEVHPKPLPVSGSTDQVIDACDTRWAAAAGPELGRINLVQESADQQTYFVGSFSAC